MAAVLGHRPGALVEGHRAAAPGAVADHGLAAVVGAERVELRVDARAVQALVVVLGDRLPVGLDLVEALAADRELGGAISVEPSGEVADDLRDRRRLPTEVDHDQPADDLGSQRHEPVAGGVEILDPLGRPGAEELAVEAVGPRVVRAGDPSAGPTALLLEEPSAAVPADVVKGARDAVLAADDEEALVADLAHHPRAGLGDRRDVGCADPPAPEELVQLPIEHGLVRERGRREHRRALERLERAQHLFRVEPQPRAHAPTSPRSARIRSANQPTAPSFAASGPG